MGKIDISNPFLANPTAIRDLINKQATEQAHPVSNQTGGFVKTKGYSSQKRGKGAKRHG